jgi:hypothetical protein
MIVAMMPVQQAENNPSGRSPAGAHANVDGQWDDRCAHFVACDAERRPELLDRVRRAWVLSDGRDSGAGNDTSEKEFQGFIGDSRRYHSGSQLSGRATAGGGNRRLRAHPFDTTTGAPR